MMIHIFLIKPCSIVNGKFFKQQTKTGREPIKRIGTIANIQIPSSQKIIPGVPLECISYSVLSTEEKMRS